MTINKNNATLDEDIYLFRLDKNIELHFSIVNNRYKFDKSDLNNIIAQTNAAYFQIRLYRSDEIKYTFAIQPTQDGVAVLTITDDLINDPIELGEYDFQISLLDADKTSMISMPIVKQQLHVCEPLVDNQAIMGRAVLGLSSLASGEIKNAFDSEGNYIREIHNDGDILSAQLVNKFEEALDTNTKAIKSQDSNLPHTISSKVLATVPAKDITLNDNITVNNVSINKDRRYYIEFLGSKKLCTLLVSEEIGNCIVCSIGNYSIQAFENSTNIMLLIELGKNDITTNTFTDLVIYEEEVKYLDSKYLETDLVLQNSISLGRVGDIGAGSSAVGMHVEASGDCSHAEGDSTQALGNSSHAEGDSTQATSDDAHAEGSGTTASGNCSHAEGSNTIASGVASHAEGSSTTASNYYSHAEGDSTTASGENSHSEGKYTTASGESSHAEGDSTTASAYCSHAEGNCTTASGENSHAEGVSTIASSQNQHVQGKYNIEDLNGTYAHIVGNGEDGKNSNAHTLDWQGNAWYSGKLSQEGTPTEDKDLVTKKYVDDNILLEQLPILRMDETNKCIYVNCNNMGTYKKYFVPNKYANVYGFSFIYTNEDSSETEIALVGGAMTRDDFILCARNTDTLFILILGGANKYTYTKSTKTLEKSLYGYLKIGNTQEYTPTNDYNPATKKYVDDNRIGYIKSETIGETIDTSTMVSSFSNNSYTYESNNVTYLEVGKEYHVIVNGVRYRALCINNMPGNDQIYETIIVTGDGFSISIVNKMGYNTKYYTDNTKCAYEIKLSDELLAAPPTIQILKMDIEYIPTYLMPKDLEILNSISVNRIGDIGTGSAAIGYKNTASNDFTFAMGIQTTASAPGAHAEGGLTVANASYSHAEGFKSASTGEYSHVEGIVCESSGQGSHAEGYYTVASGQRSHSEGCFTEAASQYQHVQGKYNVVDSNGVYAHIVGNGTGKNNRHNAHTLDWQGNAWYAGKLSQEGTPTEDKDLTTKKYVDDKVSNLPQFSFNDAGELVVTINGVSKIFVPKP
jgi:hypothetical protein